VGRDVVSDSAWKGSLTLISAKALTFRRRTCVVVTCRIPQAKARTLPLFKCTGCQC
jgi:hypothetical protein